jgi:hypothetical protein
VGGWRKLYNTELYEFYILPSILKVIKSRRTRGVVHKTRMGQREIYEGNTEERRTI